MQRPLDERIRVIDGKTFYSMVGGTPTALRDLHRALPQVISDIRGQATAPKEVAAFELALNTVYDIATVPFA